MNKHKVNPIPEGFHSLTPYLVIKGAAEAIEFYKKALGARETETRIEAPDGQIGHAEIRIGDSHVMLADEHPEHNALSPRTLGGSPVSLVVYVEDADAVFARALAAGAKEVRPMQDQFYGDRTGSIEDPYGHLWHIHTHVEDVSAEELQKRAQQLYDS